MQREDIIDILSDGCHRRQTFMESSINNSWDEYIWHRKIRDTL